MYEFELPDIGEGLAEAEIIEWHIKVGQAVKEGDVVAVVSTDKVNVDLTSPRTGTIAELCAKVGEIVPVGKVLVRIDDGRDGSVRRDEAPPADRLARDRAHSPSTAETTARARASPAVRRYAAEQGVNIDLVLGSGRGGLIVRADIDAFARQPCSEDPKDGVRDPVREKLCGARLKAAQTLARAAHTMAISTISSEILAENLVANTARSDAAGGLVEGRSRPFALAAACIVRVLAKHPRFNSWIEETDNELVIEPSVDLGVAIATEAGLVVPTITQAERKSARELDTEIADLAARARSGRLDLKRDMRRATFTISNTGGLEQTKVIATTPIVNHPTTAMLWMSRISPRPWVAGGSVVVANVLSCTIAFDHRYLNGADALAFLNDLDDEIQCSGK